MACHEGCIRIGCALHQHSVTIVCVQAVCMCISCALTVCSSGDHDFQEIDLKILLAVPEVRIRMLDFVAHSQNGTDVKQNSAVPGLHV